MERADQIVAMANPEIPEGGRAALGALGGIAFSTLAAAAYSQLNNLPTAPTRNRRIAMTAAYLVAGSAGAAIAASPGTKKPAATGAAIGVALSQSLLIAYPNLVKDYPVLMWFWEIGIPTATAAMGVNLSRG